MTTSEQFAVSTTNPSDYSVVKVGNRWDVHCNGLPVEGLRFRRLKRQALEDISKEIEDRAYRTRVMGEDETGHIWTPEEAKQIADYAERLKANETRMTMSGQMTVQESGRKSHYNELVTLRSHYGFEDWNKVSGETWKQGDWSLLVCANLRRTRAARCEAYKAAGLTLDNGFVRMTAQWQHEDSKPHTFDYQDVSKAERERDSIMARILKEETGQEHTFVIEYVPAAWPYVCRFAV